MPLSFSQEQFWLLRQQYPNSPAQNIPSAFHISGALNVPVLEQSLNAIIRRHEVLRSNCVIVDETPMLSITPERLLQLPIIDLSHLSEEERKQLIDKCKDEEVHRPFNLSDEPLIRAKLLQIDRSNMNKAFILILNIHHFVADGWSIGLLHKELTVLYAHFVANKPDAYPSQLPELPIQYSDFAYWQRQWVSSSDFARQLLFWKEQLAGVEPLKFPTEKPRPVVQSQRGEGCSFTINSTLSDALRVMSRQEGVSLFMTLMAAFRVLLYSYTQQNNVVVATVVSNRLRSETEKLLGTFANSLLLRIKVDENASFRNLLSRVRSVAVDAFANQELPFVELFAELMSEQSFDLHPLFQAQFILHERPEKNLQLANLSVENQPIPLRTSTADLGLSIKDKKGSHALIGRFKYKTDLFNKRTIEGMAKCFVTLVESIVSNPDQKVGKLLLLPALKNK